MRQEKTTLISKVRDGEQAIVLTLLARNETGEPILDSQLGLALNMAKNVVQMTGATVNASGSIVSFDQAVVENRASCKTTATDPTAFSAGERVEIDFADILKIERPISIDAGKTRLILRKDQLCAEGHSNRLRLLDGR